MKKRTYDHTRNFGDIGLKNAFKQPNQSVVPSQQSSLSGFDVGFDGKHDSSKKSFFLEYDFKPTRNDQLIDGTFIRNIVTRTNGVDAWIQRGNIWEYTPGIGKELIITRMSFFVLKSNWPVAQNPQVGPGHLIGGVWTHDPAQFGWLMADPMEYFNMINFEVMVNGVPPVSFLRRVRFEDSTGVVTDADQQGPSALSFDIINDAEPRPGSFFLRIPQRNEFIISFFNRHNGGVNEYATYMSPRCAGVRLRGFLRDITSDVKRDRDGSL